MITYKDLKNKWAKKFKQADLDNADFELNELLGVAMGVDCRSVGFVQALENKAENEQVLENLCNRRLNGEPLQYIIGEWEFYGLPFKVGEGVLVPRQDTETLVDIAVNKLKNQDNLTVIDLCSGSGCIAVAVEKNLRCEQVFCVEKSPQAFEYLKQNIRLNNCSAQAVLGDIFDENVISSLPQADLITCNPPYITAEDMKKLQREVTFEPESALFGGEDGLDYYRDIVRIWKRKLKENGMLLFEIGQGQEEEVMRMMIQHGFKDVRTRADLCGINRCVFGFMRNSPKLCTDTMKV